MFKKERKETSTKESIRKQRKDPKKNKLTGLIDLVKDQNARSNHISMKV